MRHIFTAVVVVVGGASLCDAPKADTFGEPNDSRYKMNGELSTAPGGAIDLPLCPRSLGIKSIAILLSAYVFGAH